MRRNGPVSSSGRSSRAAYRLLIAFVVTASATGCASRSPFSRSPAAVAMDDPCRYMGTYHRESRSVIEVLRMDGVVTHDEWQCMARSLESLDADYSERCRRRDHGFDEISGDQETRYRGCFAPEREYLAACAILVDEASERPDTCD